MRTLLQRLLYHGYRLLERINRRLLQRLTPAGRIVGGGLAAATVFGADTRQSGAYQVAALFAAIATVSASGLLRYRPRLTVKRCLPEFATAGFAFVYTIRIRNVGTRTMRSLTVRERLRAEIPAFQSYHAFRDQVPGEPWFDRKLGYRRWLRLLAWRRGADVGPVPIPDLAAGESVDIKLTARPRRRGYLHFDEILVTRPDPLGLFKAFAHYPRPTPLLVLPRRYRLPPFNPPGKRCYQPGGIHLARHVGDSREFLSLRDYRPGDPPRHLHWRSWARTGRPIVKEFQDEYFDRQALILDTFARADENREAFESAVSLAASFALQTKRPDSLLDLLFIGNGVVHLTGGRGVDADKRLLEALACVEPSATAGFERLARQVLCHGARLSGITCILLGRDPPRRRFVHKLRALGLPVTAFAVISDTPDTVEDPDIVGLRTGRIEADLHRLHAADRPDTGQKPAAPRA